MGIEPEAEEFSQPRNYHGPEDFNSFVMFLCVVALMVVGIAWVAVATKRDQRKLKKEMKRHRS
jgi:hypothetical protein